DLSESSKAALLAGLSWFSLSHLALFHGFDTPYRGFADDRAGLDRQFEASAIERCREFVRDSAGESEIDRFEIIARRGDPVTGLRVVVNEADTDLVIAGTHGRTGLTHVLL